MTAFDSAAPKARPLASAVRFGLLFAAVGPLVGGLLAAVVVTLLLTRLDGTGAAGVSDALRALAADAVVWAPEAYAVGTAPAALAGLAIGALSAGRRKRVVYPTALLVGALAGVTASLGAHVGQAVLLALDGAAAALVCTGLARAFRLHR